MIEDEAARRIEFMVKRRVEEELEKRKDEIETEVARRVEAAKIQMEREMMLELEKRRETAREEERKREVNILLFTTYTHHTPPDSFERHFYFCLSNDLVFSDKNEFEKNQKRKSQNSVVQFNSNSSDQMRRVFGKNIEKDWIFFFP